jgi:predicted cupin superfamily sugar epimerase
VSRWHRVDADEVWHWYAGARLLLSMSADGRTTMQQRLGNDVLGGERPQAVVPAGAWQSARSTGAWTLVGCTVAPAFDFSGFELAPSGWEPG